MLSQITTAAPWLIPVVAIGGIFGAGWKYVKLIWNRITSIVIIKAELEGAIADEALIHFWENYKCIPVNPRRFIGWHVYVRDLKIAQLVAMEQMGGTGLLFWKGWRPIWVSTISDNKDENGGRDEKIMITFMRGTFKLKTILENLCAGYNEYTNQSRQEKEKRKDNRFYVSTKSGCRGRLAGKEAVESPELTRSYDNLDRGSRAKQPLGYSWDQLGEQPREDDPSPFEFLAYPPIAIQLVDDLEHWLASQKWYADRRIPWRWGVLLAGPPGSGKSCLVRATGEHLGLPVLFFDLASMTNEDFIGAWNESVNRSPCIVAMEDIDAVFKGRVNLTAEQGSQTLPLTFDCVLNRISGVAKADGIILFVTSNDADTLDPALCDANLAEPSRPGRIDTRITLDGMDEDCRTRVAKVVLKDDLQYVESVVEKGDGDQPSQFHHRCAKLAQALYWARREGGSLDAIATKLLRSELSGSSSDNGKEKRIVVKTK